MKDNERDSAMNNDLKSKKTRIKKEKRIDQQIELDAIKDNLENNDNIELKDDQNDNSVVKKSAKELSVIEKLQQQKTKNAEPVVEEVIEEKEVEPKKKRRKKKDDSVEEVVHTRYYDTPILDGLSEEIVNERIAAGLVNVGNKDKGKTYLGIIVKNFFTFFNMLYLTITVIFLLLESYENLFFLITIIPNLIIGILAEIKAKIMLDKLSLMSAPSTTVIRNGEKIDIPIEEVVLDDIVFYTPGRQISADSIVVEGYIEVNESLLTGEADSVVKNVGDSLLSGSFVVSGAAVARVDKVGKDNYIEKLSSNAKMYKKPKSELLRTLNGIIKIVSIIIIPLAILTYIATTTDPSIWNLNRFGLIRASSSILAMIPAGLFLLTSVALFLGVIRLARSKTTVQELYCIEMLARVNVLCLDKTGTITDGTMRVCDCVEVKNYTDYTIREIVGSMMSAFLDTNPTSEALIRYFDKNKVLKATDIIPFSSKRKYSAVTFGRQGTFVLGAPEFVLFEHYDKVATKVERFSAQGCRVIVLGHTPLKIKDDLPKNIKPISLIVIQDHIRDDAADTIDYFKQNGVDVKVISGDNPITVSEIALRAGVDNADRFISLANLTDDEVRDSVFEYTVFGRVSPTQKRIIVQTLKEHKKTVAMTGDGVNDILALKEADCSIAMASGSEATRYVSHLVLEDSNFSSMPKVVGEGRRVINNIQKTSTLYLVKTLFSILLTILYIILGLAIRSGPFNVSYPFDARNLYMIEWFAIGIPSLILAVQPNREIVKGKFLPNIIKSTLPGALTVLIIHGILVLLRMLPGSQLGEIQAVYTTVATIVTTAVMFMVLFQVSHPFNWLRRVVFSLMIIASFLGGFGLISFLKLDLTFQKPIYTYTPINLTVNEDGFWELYGTETSIVAVKKPNVDIKSDQYLTPVISINKFNYWSLNGVPTKVLYQEHVDLELEVKGKYWWLNGVQTNTKAVMQPEIIHVFDVDKYIIPVLTIDKGYWSLDGTSTGIAAHNEKTLKFSLTINEYWQINNKDTNVPAEVKQEILNPDEYIPPTVEIFTKDEVRLFKINGIETDILSNDGDDISLSVDVYGFWNINGSRTNAKAIKYIDIIDEEYVAPTITIGQNGKWYLNDIQTPVVAEGNLLITEILITLLLVQLIFPIMFLISQIFRRFKVITI